MPRKSCDFIKRSNFIKISKLKHNPFPCQLHQVIFSPVSKAYIYMELAANYSKHFWHNCWSKYSLTNPIRRSNKKSLKVYCNRHEKLKCEISSMGLQTPLIKLLHTSIWNVPQRLQLYFFTQHLVWISRTDVKERTSVSLFRFHRSSFPIPSTAANKAGWIGDHCTS